jgi:hypothetical protein
MTFDRVDVDVTDATISTTLPSVIWNREPHSTERVGRKIILDAGDHIVSSRVVKAGVSGRFKRYERQWKEETKYVSSLTEKYLHPSYARIISLGWAAVPLILSSMQTRPDDWFYALRAITGDNPVPMDVAGDMRAMSEIWIAWGKARNLV